eukprot:6386743-Pyramimonas_sp.AAC.1
MCASRVLRAVTPEDSGAAERHGPEHPAGARPGRGPGAGLPTSPDPAGVWSTSWWPPLSHLVRGHTTLKLSYREIETWKLIHL